MGHLHLCLVEEAYYYSKEIEAQKKAVRNFGDLIQAAAVTEKNQEVVEVGVVVSLLLQATSQGGEPDQMAYHLLHFQLLFWLLPDHLIGFYRLRSSAILPAASAHKSFDRR